MLKLENMIKYYFENWNKNEFGKFILFCKIKILNIFLIK